MAPRRQYVATSYVYDRQSDSFFLIFHKKLGKWLPPGGHLADGEEPHQGALRELLEETGLSGRIVNLLPTPEVGTVTTAQLFTPFCVLSETIPANPREEEHIHIDFVYVVEITGATPLKLCANEVTQARWVSSAGIADLETFENVQQVCRAISAVRSRKYA